MIALAPRLHIPPDTEPVPSTKPTNNMPQLPRQLLIEQKPHKLTPPLIHILPHLLTAVNPLALAVLPLQGYHHHIGIVVPAHDVLVGVDQIVGKRVADAYHAVDAVCSFLQEVVDAVQAALHCVGFLGLEELGVVLGVHLSAGL